MTTLAKVYSEIDSTDASSQMKLDAREFFYRVWHKDPSVVEATVSYNSKSERLSLNVVGPKTETYVDTVLEPTPDLLPQHLTQSMLQLNAEQIHAQNNYVGSCSIAVAQKVWETLGFGADAFSIDTNAELTRVFGETVTALVTVGPHQS